MTRNATIKQPALSSLADDYKMQYMIVKYNSWL